MIWVLADESAGHANQALGVGDALGLPFTVKPLRYRGLAALPNLVLGATFSHLTHATRDSLAPPWPTLVIAAGRRTAPVARAIKRAAGGRSFLAQCMWPGFGAGARDFDLIALPGHDAVSERPNLFRTLAAPHRVTPAVLTAARRDWQPKLGELPAPRTALLVGGSTAAHTFDAEAAGKLANKVARLRDTLGGALMVTTSRRTSAVARDALYAILMPAHRYDWTAAGGDNPYLGYLACADLIIVTGDSTTMCAEACAAGKPVFIDAPDAITAPKHQALHRALYEAGLARPLDQPATAFMAQQLGRSDTPPLDDAAAIAAEIRRRLPDLPAPNRDDGR